MDEHHPDAQPPSPENPAPPPIPAESPADTSIGGGIFLLLGFAVLIGVNFASCAVGMRIGQRTPWGEANLIGLPLLILVPFCLARLFTIVSRWGRKPVAGLFPLFILACALELFFQYQASIGVGESHGWSLRSRDMGNLHVIGAALENHHTSHGAYPPTLEKLLPVTLDGRQTREVPRSGFGDQLPFRYTLLADPTTSASDFWFLWSPAPNGTYEIQDGPQLQDSLRRLRAGSTSPWLMERTYDPSNGASGGDIYRYRQ